MPPSLRSTSKPNTPVKATISQGDTPLSASKRVTGANEETPGTTPRKTPRCSKCHRPRAGHPRSGCPFTGDVAGDESPTKQSSTNITEAFRSMDLNIEDDDDEPEVVKVGDRRSPSKPTGRRSLGARPIPSAQELELEDTKAEIRERRRSERAARKSLTEAPSLASLDSYSSEVLRMAMDISGDTDEDTPRVEKVVHWADSIGSSTDLEDKKNSKVKVPRIAMPCSLDPPSPYSSSASLASDNSAHTTEDEVKASISVSTPSTAPRKSKGLERTMSMEERRIFVDQLERLSTAKAYFLHSADLDQILAPKGLYTRLIHADAEHPSQNVLIVGKDEKDTERLYQEVKSDRESKQSSSRRKSGGLTMAAGGALVGAVATFTGLAYS